MTFNRTCDTCKETKDWKCFIPRAQANSLWECTDCYGVRITTATVDPRPNHKGERRTEPRRSKEQRWSAFLGELNEMGR